MRQALEMALEALENKFLFIAGDGEAIDLRAKAITAIKEALAQPEQEHHKNYMCPKCNYTLVEQPETLDAQLAYYEKVADDLQALCDKQSLRIAELDGNAEPVGFVVDRYNGSNTLSLPPTATVAWLNDNPKIGQVLYTTPPQRKPLTDQQIEQLFPEALSDDGIASYWLTFARAIEAAHGIKE